MSIKIIYCQAISSFLACFAKEVFPALERCLWSFLLTVAITQTQDGTHISALGRK